MKSGSPSRTTAAHKTQTKIQAWSSLLFHCRHSSFNPSEAPPWDSRPVRGAGVVHYHLLHRPRSVPTALGPHPTRHIPPSPLAGRGVPTRLRSTKKNPGPVPGYTAARSSTSWAAHSRCHAMVLDIFGGWRWLLQSRAAGSESPVPCSSPNMADGSRLRPTGERRRLLRSLSDGSHPSSSQEHGSEPSVPPALPLLQHHRLGQLLVVSASSCCPISSAPRSPSAARALRQRVPPSSRVSAPM